MDSEWMKKVVELALAARLENPPLIGQLVVGSTDFKVLSWSAAQHGFELTILQQQTGGGIAFYHKDGRLVSRSGDLDDLKSAIWEAINVAEQANPPYDAPMISVEIQSPEDEPQKILDDLGIRYGGIVPQYGLHRWDFLQCRDIPHYLPPGVTVHDQLPEMYNEFGSDYVQP